MESKQSDTTGKVKELQELLKKTQALPQVQELSEKIIEAEVEEARNK